MNHSQQEIEDAFNTARTKKLPDGVIGTHATEDAHEHTVTILDDLGRVTGVYRRKPGQPWEPATMKAEPSKSKN